MIGNDVTSNADHVLQCGNVRTFLSFIFYVKSKSAIFTHLNAFDFCEFLYLLKAENQKINKLQSPWNCKKDSVLELLESIFLSNLLIDLQGKNFASTTGGTKTFVKSPIFCVILDHPGKNLTLKIILPRVVYYFTITTRGRMILPSKFFPGWSKIS